MRFVVNISENQSNPKPVFRVDTKTFFESATCDEKILVMMDIPVAKGQRQSQRL